MNGKNENRIKLSIRALVGAGFGILIARRSRLSRLPTVAFGLSGGAAACALAGPIKQQIAARNGNKEKLDVAMAKKAGLDTKDEFGNTPPDRADSDGDVAAIKTLIKAEADVNVKDKDGNTPLDIARSQNHEDAIKELEQMES